MDYYAIVIVFYNGNFATIYFPLFVITYTSIKRHEIYKRNNGKCIFEMFYREIVLNEMLCNCINAYDVSELKLQVLCNCISIILFISSNWEQRGMYDIEKEINDACFFFLQQKKLLMCVLLSTLIA